MLKLKYLFENYALAKKALEKWEHDDELDRLLAQFRISANAIYPFSKGGEIRFLRLAPVDEKLERNVYGELEFINWLRERGYPALESIKSTSGENCLRLHTEWGEYYASTFKKVDGTRLDRTDFSNEIMREYGRALGRLHRLAAEFTPKIKKWSHGEALDWAMGVLTEYNAPRGIGDALTALKSQLDALPKTADNYGLVHYDFEPDNVFYDEQTGLISVIDFDDGMYCWYALDIEQVFAALGDELSGEELQTAKTEFIRGYERERRYTDEMRRLLPLMRRFIDIFGYARLIRSVAERLDSEPVWMTDLRKKLGDVIAKKEESILNT